jgi:hypothetical protein
MLRLLFIVCLVAVAWLMFSAPAEQAPSLTVAEIAASELATEHHGNAHLSCDVSCVGCGHSLHDMCPSTVLLRDDAQEHLALQCTPIHVLQGHRHSLLRPPIPSMLQLA